jgi:hypothetical protein
MAIKLNYHESMIQSFDDAMSVLTRQEREEYDKLQLNQEYQWWHWHELTQQDEDNELR